MSGRETAWTSSGIRTWARGSAALEWEGAKGRAQEQGEGVRQLHRHGFGAVFLLLCPKIVVLSWLGGGAPAPRPPPAPHFTVVLNASTLTCGLVFGAGTPAPPLPPTSQSVSARNVVHGGRCCGWGFMLFRSRPSLICRHFHSSISTAASAPETRPRVSCATSCTRRAWSRRPSPAEAPSAGRSRFVRFAFGSAHPLNNGPPNTMAVSRTQPRQGPSADCNFQDRVSDKRCDKSQTFHVPIPGAGPSPYTTPRPPSSRAFESQCCGQAKALGRLQIRGGGRGKTGSKGPTLLCPIEIGSRGCLEMEGGELDLTTFGVQSLP